MPANFSILAESFFQLEDDFQVTDTALAEIQKETTQFLTTPYSFLYIYFYISTRE